MKLLILKLKSQPILHGDKIRYKKDSIVADETVAVKLVLWEDTTDKSMLVNQIQNIIIIIIIYYLFGANIYMNIFKCALQVTLK